MPTLHIPLSFRDALLVFLFFLVLLPLTFGQSFDLADRKLPAPPPAFLFRVDWHHGSDISDSRFDWVRALHRQSGFQGVDLRAGIQTSCDREWARLLNYPAIGIGYARYWFNQKAIQDMVGAPNALYVFGMFPILRTNPFQLNLDMAGGLSFNLHPYHPDKNPYNDVIGTPILGYFNFGLSGVLRLYRNIDLVAGVSMVHNSNGRIRTPNLGLDLMGFKFGLIVKTFSTRRDMEYSAGKPINTLPAGAKKESLLLPVKTSFWNLSLAGVVNSTDRREEDGPVNDIRGPQYFAMTLAAEWQRKYGGIAAYGLGLNVMYDASLNESYPGGSNGLAGLTLTGLTIGHEIFVHRLGVLTQLGLSPWNSGVKKKVRGLWYLRVGARIHVTPNWWGLIALKTMNGAVADFVEWGVGYSFLKGNKRNNTAKQLEL